MAPATAKVLAQLLELPRAERAEIVALLSRSLEDVADAEGGEPGDDDAVARAWAPEVARVAAGVADGTIATMPLDEAMAAVESELKARRALRHR